MFEVSIYTDGACSGNPGIGGYGAIVTCKGHELEVAGFTTEITTNNRMELTAVIEAVKALKKPCAITVYTDSQTICQCANHNKSWLVAETHANHDLWFELISAKTKGKHTIKFVKVAGHTGIVMNERCDKLAKAQIKKARHSVCGTTTSK